MTDVLGMSFYPLARLLLLYSEEDPDSACPKKSQGIGTITYMRAAQMQCVRVIAYAAVAFSRWMKDLSVLLDELW